MTAFPIFILKIEMVSQMKGDIHEMWSQYWDDEYEWDESFTFNIYKDEEDLENQELPDEVVNILDSGLSRSEALDVISKIEGPSDKYETLMNDLEYFDSFSEYLKFAKLEYNYKTYLALTILEVEDGEEFNGPSREGEASEMGEGVGEVDHLGNNIVMDKGKLEDFEVSLGGSGPVFSPAVVSSPLETICTMIPDRKDGVPFLWNGESSRFGDWYSLSGGLVCRPARDAGVCVAGCVPEGTPVIHHPNEIGWGKFNGPGLL